MKEPEIVRRRLRDQRLRGKPFSEVDEVVRWLGAMQSQDYRVARWSIGQRARDITASDVDRALAEGTILRTHILRPTWHFVLPEDLRWMMTLSAPRIHQQNDTRYRQLELDPKLLDRAHKALSRSLSGGAKLTRKEIGVVFDRARIPTDGQRLAYMLMHAELDALICSGGLKGKQHTYALFDGRVPQAKAISRTEALGRLAERFFRSRGPATAKDFARWASLKLTDVVEGIDASSTQLDSEVVGDRTYRFAKPSPRGRSKGVGVDLIQTYDEYVSSYGESRDVMLEDAWITPGWEDMRFYNGILLDGRLIGNWRNVPGKPGSIETDLYRPLSRAESKALEGSAERYRAFITG